MPWFNDLARRRIDAAAHRGELRGLAGEGRPLDPTRLRETADDVLSRIMADAGAVPEEIALNRQILAARDVLATLDDPEERKAAAKEIAMLDLRRNIAADARRKSMR